MLYAGLDLSRKRHDFHCSTLMVRPSKLVRRRRTPTVYAA